MSSHHNITLFSFWTNDFNFGLSSLNDVSGLFRYPRDTISPAGSPPWGYHIANCATTDVITPV